jgi:hypothetical protein
MRVRARVLVSMAAWIFQASSALAQEKCFTRLDSGVDMTGWKKSATNHHGPGDGWTVEGGALVGRQTAGNQGGILVTDKSYKDVEVVFEVKIDWGCDSGFFFRTTGGDKGYQVNIDHLQDSGVGTIWGESFAQELRYRPYFLSNNGATANKDPVLTPIFDLATWPTIWKPTDFNEIRARVEGNPPRMQVWISGTQVVDYTDQMLRGEIDAAGPLAIQVHGGAERWIPNGSVSFKNIRVKDLSVPCVDEGAGGSGGGGAGGVAGSGGGSGSATGGVGGSGGAGGTAAAGTSGAGGAAGGAPSGGGTASGAGPAASGGSIGMNGGAVDVDGPGGCGCRASGSRRSGTTLAGGLLLGLALRRRLTLRTKVRRAL